MPVSVKWIVTARDRGCDHRGLKRLPGLSERLSLSETNGRVRREPGPDQSITDHWPRPRRRSVRLTPIFAAPVGWRPSRPARALIAANEDGFPGADSRARDVSLVWLGAFCRM